MLRGAIP